MSIKHLLSLATEFESVCKLATNNVRDVFYDKIYRKLQSIVSELGSDLYVLKERNLDHTILKDMVKIYHELVRINKMEPMQAITTLTEYVLGSNKQNIDRVNALAKAHIAKSNADTSIGLSIRNPSIESLDKLKLLAESLNKFNQ